MPIMPNKFVHSLISMPNNHLWRCLACLVISQPHRHFSVDAFGITSGTRPYSLAGRGPRGAQLGSHWDVNPAIYGPWAGLRGPILVIPSPKIADCLESRGKIRG